jgi:D-xylose reductase
VTTDFKAVQLYDGSRLPSLGLGLWKIENELAAEMVRAAIEIGYRHLDAACDYGNEQESGEGIKSAMQAGICSREELWITSKLWNSYHRPEHVRPAIERSLKDLGLDYLDLYLVHFPIATKYVDFEQRYPPGWFYDPEAEQPKMELDAVPLAETWGAMEAIQRAGLTRHIGVCNFNCSLLRDLLSYAQTRPAVLQVESHPYLVQPKLLRYCQTEQIAFTAFSPLGAGSYIPLGMAQAGDSVLEDEAIMQIAQAHGKTAAQVVLRWGVQRGTAVIPKTSRQERLGENLSLFDFSLSEDEMQAISGLDRHQRYNDPGVFCEQAFNTFCPIYE